MNEDPSGAVLTDRMMPMALGEQSGRNHSMNRSVLVLAAHGSHDESPANARVRRYADAMVELNWFDEVAVAFRLGTPTFGAVLDSLAADEVTVVPVMTSKGYYSDVVLPREFAGATRFRRLRMRQTPPVGCHPDMAQICQRRIRHVLQQFGLRASDTALVVVGHGTWRHACSRTATDDLVESLFRGKVCCEVLPAFLDQRPRLENVYGRCRQPNMLVVPFFIGGGNHLKHDIPDRLGLDRPPEASVPYAGQVGWRRVVCDMAVGAYPEITDIIANLSRPHAPTRSTTETLEVSE